MLHFVLMSLICLSFAGCLGMAGVLLYQGRDDQINNNVKKNFKQIFHYRLLWLIQR
jgi:hypothetical protein